MELPRTRQYEGPPIRLYADVSYADMSDFDFFASDVSLYSVMEHIYGAQGANWDISVNNGDSESLDVVVYPDGQMGMRLFS